MFYLCSSELKLEFILPKIREKSGSGKTATKNKQIVQEWKIQLESYTQTKRIVPVFLKSQSSPKFDFLSTQHCHQSVALRCWWNRSR